MLQIWTSAGGRRDETQLGYQLAVAHDELGWTNFVEGRISKKYVEMQTDHILSNTNSRRRRKSSAKWASGLVDRIIRITHKQWLYRNEHIHYTRQFNSESPREYNQIMARITHLHENTDPDDLLPKDRYLLDQNIDDVAQWNEPQRHNFAAELEASLAERQARLEKRHRRRERLGVEVRPRQSKQKKKRKTKRDKVKDSHDRLTVPRQISVAASFAGTTSEGSQRHKRKKKKRIGGT